MTHLNINTHYFKDTQWFGNLFSGGFLKMILQLLTLNFLSLLLSVSVFFYGYLSSQALYSVVQTAMVQTELLINCEKHVMVVVDPRREQRA